MDFLFYHYWTGTVHETDFEVGYRISPFYKKKSNRVWWVACRPSHRLLSIPDQYASYTSNLQHSRGGDGSRWQPKGGRRALASIVGDLCFLGLLEGSQQKPCTLVPPTCTEVTPKCNFESSESETSMSAISTDNRCESSPTALRLPP